MKILIKSRNSSAFLLKKMLMRRKIKKLNT